MLGQDKMMGWSEEEGEEESNDSGKSTGAEANNNDSI
jgi:hypothetical protein